MTKRVKYTAIWKESIKLDKEASYLFLHYVFRLNVFIPSSTILIFPHLLLILEFPPPQFYYFPSSFCFIFPLFYNLFIFPPQSWFSASSIILLFFLPLHLLIYSIYFSTTNTLTSYRPYIDPRLNFFSTKASWIEELYTNTTTFLLFSLYHHHHISIVFPLPPSPDFYCFPPPPSDYYCFPTSPPHFYCFPSSSTSTTSSSFSLLFECGLLGFNLASLAFSRENNRNEEEEVEEVEVEEDDEEVNNRNVVVEGKIVMCWWWWWRG